MKALSIKQPWASLIVGGDLVARGPKRTENRGRALAMQARYRVGQRIAIHASKARDVEAFRDLIGGEFGFDLRRSEIPYATVGEFPTGAIIGVATLGRVFGPGELLTEDEARFYVGNDLLAGDTWGLRLDDARHFAPIQATGKLGFWTVPPDVASRVEAQLR